MTYTISIDQTHEQAEGLIKMLNELSDESDFLQILDVYDSENSDSVRKKELNSRLEYVMKNPTEGKSWDEVKKELLSL